jgi:hypothetical protein
MPPFEVQGRGLSGSLSLVARHSPLVHLEVEMEAYLRLGFWFPQKSWLPSNIRKTLGNSVRVHVAGYCTFTVMYSLYPHIRQYEYPLYDILHSN